MPRSPRPSPTDDLPYGLEPLVFHATFSPDGTEIAWLEGPEHYVGPNAQGEPAWFGEWRIRSFDAESGEERISWPFDFPTPDPFLQVATGLTHTGDHLVVSRAQVHDGLAFELELLVLDLTSEEPELYAIPVIGTADAIS